MELSGKVIVSTGGTFIPSFQWTGNNPGSQPIIQYSSFCELIALGSDTFTQQGGWV
jgi:hypothetical protein